MRPHDFLDYWDTRIEANQQLFDNHPHMANFAFRECMALWEDMNSDYAALLASHNTLVEAVNATRKQLEMVRTELQKTIGEVNIPLLMEDLAEVDRLFGEDK